MNDMRPGEEARAATPAERRRRRRKNALIFSGFLLVVLTALATTVLSVNDGRNYRRLVRQFGLEAYLLSKPASPKLRIDRQKQLSPSASYPPWLMKARLERAAHFAAAPSDDVEERCEGLRTAATTELIFTPSGKDWECVSFEEFGSGDERASVFMQAKGSSSDGLRTFRLKLSPTDPAQATEVTQAALGIIDGFGLSLSPESRQFIADRISTGTKFFALLENYKATFAREFLDNRRFNLVLVPRADTATCETPASGATRRRASTYHSTIGCLDFQSKLLPANGASPEPANSATVPDVTFDPALPDPEHPPVPTSQPEPGSSGE
jgi:hypothetical protein